MADGKKLHELHVDQFSAGAKRKRVSLPRHIRRGAVSFVKLGQPARGKNHGFGLYCNKDRLGDVQSDGPNGTAFINDNLDDREIAYTANFRNLTDFSTQRRRHRWTGVEKIDIATAPPAVARCHLLFDVIIFARPARSPRLHLEDTLGPRFTHKGGQLFVAETAAGFYSVFEME